MSNKINASKLAGSNPKLGRVEHDYYATPPHATIDFLNNVILENVERVLEPACGEGHMSKVLEKHFKNSIVDSSDLIDRGYGNAGIDFLKELYDIDYDLVITNPPFKYAQEFIEKSLKISNRYVVIFAKLQLLEGQKRYKLFKETPLKEVHVHSSRVSPYRNGSEVDENGKNGVLQWRLLGLCGIKNIQENLLLNG